MCGFAAGSLVAWQGGLAPLGEDADVLNSCLRGLLL